MLINTKHYDFQDDAVEFLLGKSLEVGSKQTIVLKAPTGAGKTILLISYIDQYLAINSNTVFVWLCPGKGDLEEQSKKKMDKFCPNRTTQNLQDVLTGGFAFSSTVFINWELITKRGNKAITDSEQKNLYERIDDAHRNGTEFIIVVDEEHSNYTSKADAIMGYFNARHIVRVSATPTSKTNVEKYDIPEEQVINSGLITRAIYINPDFKTEEVVDDENIFLLDLADEKRKEINAAYKELGKDIRPLVLIQFPNDNQALIDSVVKHLKSKGYTYDNGMVAIWMSNEKKNLEGIEEPNAAPVFLLMKQAIAMGWDCTRAKVLLKIRDNMGEVFTIQTIGRLRRMPEAMHYDDSLLNYCYVYTTDSEWKTGLIKSCSDAYELARLFLKEECKNFKLTREVHNTDDELDERVVYKKLYEHFQLKYKTGNDLAKNKVLLENAGYDFYENLHSQVRSDVITNTAGIADGSGDYTTINIAVNTHRHGASVMTAANDIGSTIGMKNYRMGAVLQKLFKYNKSSKYDIQDLQPKEYIAFIINNQEKLKNEVREIAQKISEQQNLYGKFKELEFKIPLREDYRYDAADKERYTIESNSYKEYPSSVLVDGIRSKTERLLERFFEDHREKVQWVYKNGDNGLQYFGIVYRTGVGKISEFYPDYIIKSANGGIWIIEAKGGKKADGESNNIDIHAANKFDALKRYANKYKDLHWGFVREANEELRFNNTEWQEDVMGGQWKLLKNVF